MWKSVWAFSVAFAIGAAIEVERPVIFLLEESFNTRAFAAFFDQYTGRSEKYSFHLYRTSFPKRMEKVVSTKEANSILEALAIMAQNPLDSDCDASCCCGSAFFTFFPQLLKEYPGGLFVNLVDCYRDPSEATILELVKEISRTKSTVVVLLQHDSYCDSIRGERKITDYTFEVSSLHMDQALSVLLLFFNSEKESALYSKPCNNQTIPADITSNTQAFGVILAGGKLTRPISLTGPDGNLYTKNKVVHLNDGEASQIIIYYSDCPPDWSFSGGYCVFRQRLPTNFQKADEYCRNRNGTLLSPVAAQNAELLADDALWQTDGILSEQTSWLTVDDWNLNKQLRWKLRGTSYIELKNLNFTSWDQNEPSTNIPSGNRCLAVNRRTSKWAVVLCNGLRAFTCIQSTYYITAGKYVALVDSYVACSLTTFELK